MRRGELLGLRWRAVELADGVIEIQSSKSGKRRRVPLRPEVVEALHGLRRVASGDFVFAKADGLPLGSINTAFQGAVKRAGIRRIRFHDLRHTAASWMAQRGADLLQIKDVLGHATITTTQRYAHLVKRNAEQAVACMPGLDEQETATRSGLQPARGSSNGGRFVGPSTCAHVLHGPTPR